MTDHITRLKEALEDQKPVAYLHEVRHVNGDDVDQALSFEYDDFPLSSIYESLLARPLYTTEQIRELLERLEQAEKDARRYRWLREGHKGCYDTVMIYAGGALDAVVDAAIASQEGGK